MTVSYTAFVHIIVDEIDQDLEVDTFQDTLKHFQSNTKKSLKSQ